MNRQNHFYDSMRAAGLEPPETIQPGRMHRFPGIGKGASNTAGWCVLFDGGMGGCFGDWSTGLSESWRADRGWPLSRLEQDTFRRQVAEARARADMELEALHADAAERASAIWSAAVPADDDHPYLLRKGIKPNGAKLHHGALVLPVMSFGGELTSLQFIDAAGSKRLLTGGRKRGCYIPVSGDMAAVARVVICEGWATGCTLAEGEAAAAVIAAIDAGNLEPVAVETRCAWPAKEIVVAGDDDRCTPGNPGATKARAAALAADALLALPQWPAGAPEALTDFNDLVAWVKRGAQ